MLVPEEPRAVPSLDEVRSVQSGITLEELSKAAVKDGLFGYGFVKPAYDNYCFANLPGFIEELLTGETDRPNLPGIVRERISKEVKNVVFVFFDAFGWESYERFADSSPFLKAIEARGHVMQTTSQFPSTTAAHVTTLATGQPVYESGICEWYYYEPNADDIINPFQLRTLTDDSKTPTLLNDSKNVGDVLIPSSFFSSLADKGVTSFRYTPQNIVNSAYSQFYFGRAKPFGYNTLVSGVNAVRERIDSTSGPELHYLYYSDYDEACHSYAPFSDNADKKAREGLRAMNQLLNSIDESNTLLLFTADHGQVSLKNTEKLCINQIAPAVLPMLRKSKEGEMIRPGGSPRDLLLYTKPGFQDTVANTLRAKLGDAAVVYTQVEAFELGLLGRGGGGVGEPSARFKERMGDVLILPTLDFKIAWHERNHFVTPDDKLGMHGGLSTQEMETPLLLL